MRRSETHAHRHPRRPQRARSRPRAGTARPSLLENVSKATSFVVLGAALLNGVGAVIVGTFYRRYGIPLLAIPGTRYAVAAIGFLLLSGPALVLGALAGMKLVSISQRRLRSIEAGPRRPLVVFSYDMLLSVGFVALLVGTVTIERYVPGLPLQHRRILLSSAMAGAALPYFHVGLGLGTALITCALVLGVRRRVPAAAVAVFALAGVFWLVTTCSIYGSTLYGYISPLIGGGRPAHAAFYVNAAAVDMLRESAAREVKATPVRATVAKDGEAAREVVYVTEPLEILDEDKDYYSVLLPAKTLEEIRCVRLPKAATSGVSFRRLPEIHARFARPAFRAAGSTPRGPVAQAAPQSGRGR